MSRRAFNIMRQRTRGPKTPCGAAAAQYLSAAASRSWMGWLGTLWWIRAFGSRSARSEGLSISNGSQARVSVSGPEASRSSHAHRRPISSQVPSMMSPPGASLSVMVAQACATSDSGY
ncbi:Uncharacterised protein [Mycobacteroides abscessus subsp. abscessus]|nr:Uncharacterised protein [Mycobacteroides abscessus subsp. abscessus]